MYQLLKVFVFSCLCALTSIVFAQENHPITMLESVTDEVLTALKDKKDTADNTETNQDIMERIMLPHIDIKGMARWVAGRTAWVNAQDAEQDAFTAQFRYLIINTYSSALSEYRGQTIEYLPLRGDLEDKKRVQVTSLVHEPNVETLNIVYRLTKKKDGWKVYDIIIEGVSLLKGFQSQFQHDIKQKGLAAVTSDLREHNEKNRGKTKTIKHGESPLEIAEE